jgi:Putative SAM-dependent methyltransferase
VLDTFESVLESLDQKGQEKHGSMWMNLVKDRVGSLEEAYKILNHDDRMPIDYRDLPTQAAYIFAYAMPRAYYSDEFLRRHHLALGKSLFKDSKINVVSFGGGPGSELVGLLNYLDDEEMDEPVTSVSYRVYDKDGDWKSVAEQVVEKVQSGIKVDMAYHQLDLADDAATALVDVTDADLIVFSYVMSELCSLEAKDRIASNVNEILGKMRSGSAMLFIESKHPDFINFFKKCKGFHGKQINEDCEIVNITAPNFQATFENYKTKLGRSPRMSSEKIISKWYVKS